MRFLSIYVIIYLVVLCYASLCDAITDTDADFDVLENFYIIQYEPSLTSGIILDRIRDAGINYTHRFNLDVIDSISVKLHLAEDVDNFSQIPGVDSIYPVTRMKSRLFTAHEITGVDVFRQKTGFDGKGVKVGVIDSGIDYTHPAFGNCFRTTGCRIQFGYDLLGEGDILDPKPDDDPFETCGGHGTHVAGIVAADDHDFNFTGVAPGATLGIYKALDCNLETTNDLVIQALQHAYDDGMDVVNLSLGGRFRAWSDTPLGLAVDKMVDKGLIVVVAASASGQNGLFGVGDPDSATKALTVGEVDNLRYLSYVLTLNSQPDTLITYLTTALTTRFEFPGPIQIEIANRSTNLPESDGCTAYENQDFTNKIVLIRRGGCSFDVKNANAKDVGAIATMIYNNDSSLVVPLILFDVFPSTIITNEDAEIIKKQIRKHHGVTVSFPDRIVSVVHQNAGLPSDDSSWGPTFDLDIKPEILAPGGRIFSTFPVELGKYATISGTSMASAYGSGSVALYLQATGLRRGTVDPLVIRDIFTYSAKPYHNTTDNKKLMLSVDKQGGGLVDIKEAVKTKVLIKPSKLLLNDSAHFDGYKTLTLTNFGKKTTKYTLSHLHAPTIRGFFANVWIDTRLFVYEKKFARVKFSKNCVIVRPGKSVTIKVKFTEPSNIPNDFGVYSGYISIKDSVHKTTSTVPYLGVKGDLKNKLPVLTRQGIFIPTNPDVIITREDQIVKTTFIDLDFPVFTYFLNYGSRKIQMELYKKGDFTPSGFVGLPIYDINFPNPDILSPRNGGSSFPFDVTIKPWSSRLVTKTIGGNPIEVPAGQYQGLLSVLKPFGNPNNPHDFIKWESPIIEIIDSTATTNQTTTTATAT